MWVICNAITGAVDEVKVRMIMLSENQLLPAIVECLRSCNPDQRLIKNIMESLDCILKLDLIMGWSNTEQSQAYLFERTGGLDVLDETQRNPNYEIYKAAADLTKKYFEIESEMEVTGPSQ